MDSSFLGGPVSVSSRGQQRPGASWRSREMEAAAGVRCVVCEGTSHQYEHFYVLKVYFEQM